MGVTYTENYNLILPDGSEKVMRTRINDNMETIDAQMKANADATAGKQVAITATGLLKGDGAGGVTAAVPNTDYAAAAHAARHASGGADPLTPASIGAAAAVHSHSGYLQGLTFTGVSVSTASFVSNATYTNWPYRAAVALTGVTADMVPDVVFAPDDATGGVLAPVAACYAGGVYLYAKSVPSAAMTVPTIRCTKGVS